MNMTIKTSVNLGGQISEGTVSAVGDGQNNADVALAGAASAIHILEAFKMTDLAAGALVFFSTVVGCDVTIKTNSSGSPDNTFVVPGGGAIRVSALAADIASLYATNGSADTATVLQIRGVKDVTP
jgi:hypothetical protein